MEDVDGISYRPGSQQVVWGIKAINNLDFYIDEGEIVGIIGPNGSGKTTTLNLLTGFLKPNSGKITLLGNDITGLPRYKVCQKGIARTFQLCKPFMDFTALQNVMVGRVYGQNRAAISALQKKNQWRFLNWSGLGVKHRYW